jgi:hypothetical protein
MTYLQSVILHLLTRRVLSPQDDQHTVFSLWQAMERSWRYSDTRRKQRPSQRAVLFALEGLLTRFPELICVYHKSKRALPQYYIPLRD